MVKVKISKRAFYTLILIVGLLLVVGGIYALSPGFSPAGGHLLTSEIAPPSPCDINSFVKWTGSAWQCAGLP